MTLSEQLFLISPELVLLIAGLAVFTVDLFSRRRGDSHRPAEIVTLGGLVVALALSFALVNREATVATMLRIDAFAMFFKITVLVGMLLVFFSGIEYVPQRTRNVGEFYALLLFGTLAMTMTASANNIVLIYLGLEFLSITSYILVGFIRNDVRSNEAAIKYFLYGATASAVMLYGLSLLYGATGSIELVAIAQGLQANQNELGILIFPAVVLIVVGFGFKTSLVPFHQWAPDAYDGAPTPVAAFLSTASKAIGFAVMLRVFVTAMGIFEVDWALILAAVSMVTMTVGNLIALKQTNIKRMIAYSSIAQAGYIVMGLAAVALDGVPGFNGLNGVLIYTFAYLFTNIGAFLVVLAVEQHTGSVQIKEYAGLFARAPGLAVMFFILLLSLTGIPPTGGFIGKFFVFGAAIQREMILLAVVGALNAAVAAYYYLNVVRHMFFMQPDGEVQLGIHPAVNGALVATVVITILLGVYPQPLINWATQSTQVLAAVF